MKIDELFKQIKKVIPLNKISVSLILVCVFFLVWGGFRACSAPRGPDPDQLYRIGRDPTWYPLNLMGKEKNVLAFSNDLLLTIAKRQKIRLELVGVNSSVLFEGLDRDEFQGVISSMMPNVLNNRRYDFSEPFFLVGPVLIVREDSNIKSLEEMKDRIIGIKSDVPVSLSISKYPVYYKSYSSMTDAFNDLIQKRIDGMLMPILQADTYINTFHHNEFKVVTPPLTDEGLRLITRKNPIAEYLLDQFNEGLHQMYKDGAYAALLKKWDLVEPNHPENFTLKPLDEEISMFDQQFPVK